MHTHLESSSANDWLVTQTCTVAITVSIQHYVNKVKSFQKDLEKKNWGWMPVFIAVSAKLTELWQLTWSILWRGWVCFCHWVSKLIALEQSATITYYLLPHLRNMTAMGFHKKNVLSSHVICLLMTRNQMILSCQHIENQVRRCVLTACHDWLTASVTQSLVTC